MATARGTQKLMARPPPLWRTGEVRTNQPPQSSAHVNGGGLRLFLARSALGELGGLGGSVRPCNAFDICHEVYVNARQVLDHQLGTLHLEASSKYLWRPDVKPKLGEFVADFALAGRRALAAPRLASRRILFELYYLGGAEYHAARRQMGISELTWAQWADEIRDRVGRELLRARLLPPGRYFHEPSGG